MPARRPGRRRCRGCQPLRALRRCISCSRVPESGSRSPDRVARAMALPLMLILSRSSAVHWPPPAPGGKGLVGLDQIQLINLPAGLAQQRWVALTGPMPMIAGSTRNRAGGDAGSTGRPSSAAVSALISMTAAAPSLRLEALPAVTVRRCGTPAAACPATPGWYWRGAVRPGRCAAVHPCAGVPPPG